jgi:chemotaxis protein methyltransferase CheR
MSGAPGPAPDPPIARLAALVRDELGLELPAGRLPYLAEVARRRAVAAGAADLAAYGDLLARRAPGEWEALASLLTIRESSFFRSREQWERLRSTILPAFAESRAATRTLTAWSAGCAAGEEPGTLALVLAEEPLFAAWSWKIVATDLDREALAHAELGQYGERAVAAVPEELRLRRFTRRGSIWELDPALRARIAYRRLNLAQPGWRLPEAPFDLIYLRNVLIYFRPELQRKVVDEAIRRLAPDGWLFLGGTETLWRVHDGLEAIDLGGCFGYRIARGAPRGSVRPRSAGAPRPAEPRRESGGRLRPAPEPARSAGVPSAAERLVAAARALEVGRLDDARSAVERLLAEDPADPAAHALAGAIAERAGEPSAAADAYRAALYLEPELVAVRLRLADRMDELGQRGLALRQYREVIAIGERGDARELATLSGILPGAAEALRRARAALARD